ncbi:MAG: aminotransferase class I/II-fold pyridoxal phosphate-dependent enzyme, partial [Planctomycetes bacterium]|nr:aminotransferase class I/II-fold pyridoxal phosphate-dependent enzyme [Planctomycetota bacterium]
MALTTLNILRMKIYQNMARDDVVPKCQVANYLPIKTMADYILANSFVKRFPLPHLHKNAPVFIKTTDSSNFKLTIEDLKRSITDKTKLLILNSPCNPTGTVYTKEELHDIVDFAISAGLYIISDEIYEKNLYYGQEQYSPASFGEKFLKNVITVNCLSKTFSMTGWRIGYTAGPEELIKAATLIQDHSTSCPNSFTQKASITALGVKDEAV